MNEIDSKSSKRSEFKILIQNSLKELTVSAFAFFFFKFKFFCLFRKRKEIQKNIL